MNVEKFKNWLVKRGAIVLAPTNDWELVRFKTNWGTSIIYTKADGSMTFTGESKKAYEAYTENKTWKAVNRERQALRAKKTKLAARDGKKCFYHGGALSYDMLTIEHFVAVSHGGTDHDSNLCLACIPCNQAVGNLPVTQKIAYRDKLIAVSVDNNLVYSGVVNGARAPETAEEMRNLVQSFLPGGKVIA